MIRSTSSTLLLSWRLTFAKSLFLPFDWGARVGARIFHSRPDAGHSVPHRIWAVSHTKNTWLWVLLPTATRAHSGGMARPLISRTTSAPQRRWHRSTLRQFDRQALERLGWRTTLEFRENHVRLGDGQLIDVEQFWTAEAERDGVVISASARSESRAWSRLQSRS